VTDHLAARALALALFIASLAGCATSPIRVPSLDEVERVRATEAAQEGARGAPEVFARAEQERHFAEAAHATGDDVAAKLHAERAIAAYGHALVVARLAVALAQQADAQHALDEAAEQEQSLEVSRSGLETEAIDLAERARIARERLLPAPSEAASGDRAAARLAAARSLAIEAKLLCGAARLVAADTTGVAEAEAELSTLEADLGRSNHGARRGVARDAAADAAAAEPIDEAGAVRAHCLDVLTRARRAEGEDGRADSLLSELAAAGAWSPVRDERGVVVTLRGAFRGVELSDEGQASLKALGQVAAAHPGFAVQVVLHDAQPNVSVDSNAKRAEAMVKVLVAAGASAARVKAELAGALAPVVDPAEPALRARNERVDIVFVAGG
jgi:flagellar motor protein MotB